MARIFANFGLETRDGSILGKAAVSEKKNKRSAILDDLIRARRSVDERETAEKPLPPDTGRPFWDLPSEAESDEDNRFEMFFEHMPYGVLLAEIERDRYGRPEGYKVKRVNLNYPRLLGVDRADLVSRHFFEMIPGGREDWEEQLANTATKSQRMKAVCYFEETDRYLEVIVFKPRRELLAVLIRDVREEARSTSSVGRKELESRDILDSAPGLICRFKPDGELVYANDAYKEFLEKDPELLCGHCFVPTVPKAELDFVRSTLASLTRAHPTVTYEHSVLVGEKARWAEWTDQALFDADGGLVGYLSSGMDITERKENDATMEERCGFMEDLVNHRADGLRVAQKAALAGEQQIAELEGEVAEMRDRLQLAMSKTITGRMMVCSRCSRVHDDEGHWVRVDMYMRSHTLATVFEDTCPYCVRKP